MKINIKPSATIRNNYNDIVELSRKTDSPVYLTKNGEGDSVVMDIDVYNKREQALELREILLSVEEDRIRGEKGYTIDEVDELLSEVIREASK